MPRSCSEKKNPIYLIWFGWEEGIFKTAGAGSGGIVQGL